MLPEDALRLPLVRLPFDLRRIERHRLPLRGGERVRIRTAGGLVAEAVAREGREVVEGSEAHAAVRPEKVRFGEVGENVAAAEVRQIVYLGASTQYITELADGTRVVLYQQNAHDATGPGVGDEVSVAWDARNCLVLGG